MSDQHLAFWILFLCYGGLTLYWVLQMREEWRAYGFANWLVRRLYDFAQFAKGLAQATDRFVATYRMVQAEEPAETYTDMGDGEQLVRRGAHRA